ncbi:MAG: DUF2339 domain-containing protein, partial [Victivallaceae bacterium]|nr:DUF2339 domain-containing protein [Victivallaceae bacterium]
PSEPIEQKRPVEPVPPKPATVLPKRPVDPPKSPKVSQPAPITPILRYIAIGDVKPGEKIEFAIATTWLLRLAALVILTGIGFFVHYSYTRNLLPPEVRIGLTMLFGALLTAGGVFISKRKWFVFGVTLTGIGFAVLYFAVMFASQMYHLCGNETTLAASLLLTAAAVVIALKLNAMPVALIGMAGGYVPIIWLSQNSGITNFTTAAVVLLGLGVAAVSGFRRWHLVTLNSLIFSIIALDSRLNHVEQMCILCALQLVIFSAATTLYALRHREAISCRNFLMLTAAQLVFTLIAATVLADKFNTPAVTAFAPGFTAVIDAGLATWAVKRKSGGKLLTQGIFVLGVAMLAAVMFVALDNCTLTAALIALGIVLLYFAKKSDSIAVYITGSVVLIAAAFALIGVDTNHYFIHQSTWLGCLVERLISLGGLAIGAAAAARFTVGPAFEQKQCRVFFSAAALALLFVMLTFEVNLGLKINFPAARQGAVSVLWAGYALTLIAVGFRRLNPVLRWVGLALFLVTVGKVFIYDLETVKALFRVGALMIFGLLLLGGAFTYIKLKDRL